MIRLLLSLLALVSGIVMPGMAQARAYGACETEIGVTVAPARATPAVRQQVAAFIVQPGMTERLRPAPQRLRFGNAPAPATVLIGIDRAHA